MQLSHVRLLVRDYGTSFRFWRDVVGLDPVFGDESGTYASFDAGFAHLSIYLASEMTAIVRLSEPPLAADRTVVQLDVPSVDAAVDRLRAAGVAVTDASDQPGWGIRVAHFRDPEGNLMELAQPLPGTD